MYNHSDGYFIQSNTEFVANGEQNNSSTNYVDIDDAWLRVGKWKMFDLTVGRLQGFEVYHYGMGLDLNTYERLGAASFSKTPAQPYGLDDLWDRGVNNGAAALHWYYPQWLRLEFLTRIGVSGQGKELGIRPVGVLDFGWVKLKGGYERTLSSSLFRGNDARVEQQGLGASLQFILKPWVEFGGNIARRTQDAFEADGGIRQGETHTTRTVGGFINVRPYFEDWAGRLRLQQHALPRLQHRRLRQAGEDRSPADVRGRAIPALEAALHQVRAVLRARSHRRAQRRRPQRQRFS